VSRPSLLSQPKPKIEPIVTADIEIRVGSEFTPEWWGYLMATGFFLACTLGCKMVGLFTFATIGGAVIWDLWGILDIKKGHSMASPISCRRYTLKKTR
jgi:dolichyl-phosphate-mannose--protein O-mannosyl transferase